LQRIDFLRKKVVKIISGTYCYATDCTTDGKWVIYADKRNPRYDKGTLERVIIDFWRFNLITGQRQKFAIASDGTEGKWSPDGKKLLFGGPKPRSSIGQPEPKWKLVWTKTGGAFRQWLSDSSGIVIIARDKIYIEQAEKETVQLLNIDLGYIRILRVDRSNRIYLISRSKPGRKKEQLVRCEINGDTLRCEDALKRDKSILWYDITPDGEQIVFLEEGNTCAWHMRSRSSGPQCVVQQAGPTISISPDGKWLAFTRYRKIGESSGTDVVENDLYVTTLEDK
jgi:Tol biopolymer transport system component